MKVCLITLALFSILQFVATQDIEGFPSQVCGEQTFTTTFATTRSTSFQITSSAPQVTVSPTSVSYSTASSTQSITVNCQTTGPVELIFSSVGRNIEESVRFYCTGIITVLNPPMYVARGSEFELDITLSPTAVEPVNLIVESLSSLVTPGSERVIYGIEQSLANEIFFVPFANVGEAELLFRSRSLRDYSGPNCEALSVRVNVQGEMFSSLPLSLIGTTTTVSVNIFVDPAPLEAVDIMINTNSIGVASSEVVTVQPRQNEVEFQLTVTEEAFNTGCVTFSSQFYATVTDCFTIGGIFDSDIESEVNVAALETFSVVITPAAGDGGLFVSIESSSNVMVDQMVFIPEGENSALFQVDSLSAGEGSIEFSASGYVSKKISFTIIDVQCDAESQVINQNGDECLSCPSTNGVVCSNQGECRFSEFASEKARCVCNEDFFGPQCEFSEDSMNLMTRDFTFTGLIITTGLIPSTYSTEIRIPSNLLQDGLEGSGRFYLQPYLEMFPFYGAIDPKMTLPTLNNQNALYLPSGFNFDVVSGDNTQVMQLDVPIEFIFDFDAHVFSQMQFLQMELFYWQPMMGWVPAVSVCQQQFILENYDLIPFTLHTALCATGQYQFFQVQPSPVHTVPVNIFFPNERFVYDDFAVYYDSDGIGGVRGVEPPQPTFTDPQAFAIHDDDEADDSDMIDYDPSDTRTVTAFTDISFASPSEFSAVSPLSTSSSDTSTSPSSDGKILSVSFVFVFTLAALVLLF